MRGKWERGGGVWGRKDVVGEGERTYLGNFDDLLESRLKDFLEIWLSIISLILIFY